MEACSEARCSLLAPFQDLGFPEGFPVFPYSDLLKVLGNFPEPCLPDLLAQLSEVCMINAYAGIAAALSHFGGCLNFSLQSEVGRKSNSFPVPI